MTPSQLMLNGLGDEAATIALQAVDFLEQFGDRVTVTRSAGHTLSTLITAPLGPR